MMNCGFNSNPINKNHCGAYICSLLLKNYVIFQNDSKDNKTRTIMNKQSNPQKCASVSARVHQKLQEPPFSKDLHPIFMVGKSQCDHLQRFLQSNIRCVSVKFKKWMNVLDVYLVLCIFAVLSVAEYL